MGFIKSLRSLPHILKKLEMVLRINQDNSEVVLIRLESDRVVILDRRVLTKQYGRLFLESLPLCTARQGPAANLSREAGKWLGI